MLTFGIEGFDNIEDYVFNLASELDILKYDADIDIRFVFEWQDSSARADMNDVRLQFKKQFSHRQDLPEGRRIFPVNRHENML